MAFIKIVVFHYEHGKIYVAPWLVWLYLLLIAAWVVVAVLTLFTMVTKKR